MKKRDVDMLGIIIPAMVLMMIIELLIGIIGRLG